MSTEFLKELEEILQSRKKEMPEGSYTTSLLEAGRDKILQKFGEESIEYLIDAKNGDAERTISEGADLMYHFILSLVEQDLSIEDVVAELKRRHE